MISFRGVSHWYGDRVVLSGVELDIPERRVAFVGGNGSGKSTLARMINGLVNPARGRVVVNELDVAREGRKVRRQVGFVFTDPDSQIVMPTVAEDVAFSLRRSGLSRDQIADRVDEMLTKYGLAGHRDHPAHLLSGGQKQLLALIAVLVTEPRILVCDEPTTLLDLRNKKRFAALLSELPQQVLLVTHDLETVAEFDRVIVIDEGRVVADDAPAPAVAYYRALIEKGAIGESAIEEGAIGGGTIGEGAIGGSAIEEGAIEKGAIGEGVIEEGASEEGAAEKGVVAKGVEGGRSASSRSGASWRESTARE